AAHLRELGALDRQAAAQIGLRGGFRQAAGTLDLLDQVPQLAHRHRLQDAQVEQRPGERVVGAVAPGLEQLLEIDAELDQGDGIDAELGEGVPLVTFDIEAAQEIVEQLIAGAVRRPRALAQYRHRALEPLRSAQLPRDLAGAGLDDAAVRQDGDQVDFDLAALANGDGDRLEIGQIVRAVRLGHDCDALATLGPRHREGGDIAGSDLGGGALDHRLDVARVEVPAVADDHVLEAPADEQLAIVQEAHVAGAEERRLGRVAG